MTSFPAVPDKFGSPEIIRAADVVADWRESGLAPDLLDGAGAILTYDRRLQRRIGELVELERVRFAGPGRYFRILGIDAVIVVASDFGIGAPAAAAVVEALIGAGTDRIVSIGTAGGLQHSLDPGDIVGVTGAVRDDGTSHHYFGPDHVVAPDPALTDRLLDRLGGAVVGTGEVWTTDAVYRETVAELEAHRAAGVWAVEMEAAALMAVCELRDAAFASAVCVSDVLSEEGWEARFSAPVVRDALDRLFHAAVDTLS